MSILPFCTCKVGLQTKGEVNENTWALTSPPVTCPPRQYSRPKEANDVMTSHHDVMWRHAVTFYVICHDKMNLYRSTHQKLQHYVFPRGDLDLWPIILTFELIRDIIRVNPHIKFYISMSNGSATRELTDGTDFIPSTVDAGGNQQIEIHMF